MRKSDFYVFDWTKKPNREEFCTNAGLSWWGLVTQQQQQSVNWEEGLVGEFYWLQIVNTVEVMRLPAEQICEFLLRKGVLWGLASLLWGPWIRKGRKWGLPRATGATPKIMVIILRIMLKLLEFFVALCMEHFLNATLFVRDTFSMGHPLFGTQNVPNKVW